MDDCVNTCTECSEVHANRCLSYETKCTEPRSDCNSVGAEFLETSELHWGDSGHGGFCGSAVHN